MMRYLIILMFSLLSGSSALAQDVEMADAMVANGKIYVVVGVLAIIFVGLVVYLFTIDKRVSKIEKDLK